MVAVSSASMTWCDIVDLMLRNAPPLAWKIGRPLTRKALCDPVLMLAATHDIAPRPLEKAFATKSLNDPRWDSYKTWCIIGGNQNLNKSQRMVCTGHVLYGSGIVWVSNETQETSRNYVTMPHPPHLSSIINHKASGWLYDYCFLINI